MYNVEIVQFCGHETKEEKSSKQTNKNNRSMSPPFTDN